jgi:cytoskeletal protein CcmA (bactofilin family)|tara:strand:+ start:537 stop:1910 length:1374 start_codon:yes stop_codon:yes gene_type:complete
MALRLRRGTNAQRGLITPLDGELIYTTDTKKLYVGDGTTAGGLAVDTAGTFLGADLDLNNYNLNGTGNVNIAGNITATGNITTDGNLTIGGNITIGDSSADTINLSAKIESDIIPDVDGARSLGAPTQRFAGAHLNTLTVTDQIDALSINANVIGNDSTVLLNVATGAVQVSGELTGTVKANDATTFYNPALKSVNAGTGTFTGTVVAPMFQGILDGDMTGSVYADDSTALIDGVGGTVLLDNGSIYATGDTLRIRNGLNIKVGDVTDSNSTGLQITTVDGSPPVDLVTLGQSSFGGVSKFTFTARHGDIQTPVQGTAGDYLGAFSAQSYDAATDAQVPASVITFQIDPNTTAANDTAKGKIMLINNNGTGSAPDLVATSISADGSMAIANTISYVPLATLDVNGFAKLKSLATEPNTPTLGMIAVADRATWDPVSVGSGNPYPVFYDGAAWVKLIA